MGGFFFWMSGFLRGAISVVTGAGSGIGQGVARMMAQQGSKVAVCDLSLSSAKETVKQIEDAGGNAVAIEMDVTSETQVTEAFKQISSNYSTERVDVLVANAGFQHISSLDTFDYPTWQKMMEVHVNGSFLTAKEAIKRMKIKESNRSGGSVIFMGSVHSKEASLNKSAYITAKHGLMGLTRALAKEGGPHKIRSNLVCPGFVLTPLVKKQIPEQAQQLNLTEKQVVEQIMLVNTVDKEFTTVEEVARVCCFFADSNSCSLTGQSMTVSHGWNMS